MRKKLFWVVALSIVWGMFAGTATAESPTPVINWYSYDEGIALGKAQSKKVFLHFWAEWCGYCAKMEAETFTDKKVISYLNANYVAIKVDSDREPDTAQKYRVRGLPANYFLAHESSIIANLPGFIPPAMMLKLLKFVYTDSYQKMSLNKFLSQK